MATATPPFAGPMWTSSLPSDDPHGASLLQPGHTIDRYKVESLLGSGGTAVVYKVKHRQLNTTHALKVLSITSSSIRERMIREGQVQATLRHLNVVAVTDVLDIDGAPGLLLEYIEGPSLEDALRRYRLSLDDAETLFLGILSGVRHAHQHGLVHRDLKPANVLLARTPEGFVPKVTDFGLAKVLQGEGEATGQTRNGIAMGTPHYMAPEQIRDARNVDQRADVFSLGCLLYELCTGERTFPGDNALAIYNAVCAGEFVPPRDIAPDLPDRFDVAIRGALLLDPSKRIPDCDTLLAVLKGEQAWNVPNPGKTPSPAPTRPPSLPPGELEKTEAIPLAARGEDGTTPAPAPSRSRSGPLTTGNRGRSPSAGLGVEVVADSPRTVALDSSDSLSRRRPVTPSPVENLGTLGGEDSFEKRRSPVGVLVGVAVGLFALMAGGAAIIAIVAAVLFGSPPDEDPAVMSSAVQVPPATPPKAEAPEVVPAPEAAPAEVPAKAEPKAEPKPQVVDDTPVPVRTTSRASENPKTSAAPASGGTSTVKILSVPPTAAVSIDGASKTPTPLKIDLPVGKHQVEVQSGDAVGTFTIEVQPGIDNKWCYAFDSGKVHPGSCPR
jgi:serine/threonine protein kinase